MKAIYVDASTGQLEILAPNLGCQDLQVDLNGVNCNGAALCHVTMTTSQNMILQLSIFSHLYSVSLHCMTV